MTTQDPRWRPLAVAALFFGCALGLVLGCSRSSPTEPKQRPTWLNALIAQMQSEPVTSPPSSIVRYRYRGDFVYFRPARCCDFPSVLYDTQGAVVCNPDGGLAGGGDERCADFFTARREETLIWRDSR